MKITIIRSSEVLRVKENDNATQTISNPIPKTPGVPPNHQASDKHHARGKATRDQTDTTLCAADQTKQVSAISKPGHTDANSTRLARKRPPSSSSSSASCRCLSRFRLRMSGNSPVRLVLTSTGESLPSETASKMDFAVLPCARTHEAEQQQGGGGAVGGGSEEGRVGGDG